MTADSNCTGVGTNSLILANNSQGNTALGAYSLHAVASGSYNTAIGLESGSNYTGTESNNILVGHSGVLGESNVMRLGTPGSGTQQVNKTFVAGVTGVTVTASAPIAVNSSGQFSSLGFGTSTQVLTSNGAGVSPSWQAAGGVGGFTSIKRQVFATNGTYTPTSGMLYCDIQVLGGGGGGGGAGTYGGPYPTSAGGGGAGGYAQGIFSAATIGASQTVTIGAGGTAGVGGTGAAGANGGTTSVGSLISATGGLGALTSVGSNMSAGGAGGTGTGGDFQTSGAPGITGSMVVQGGYEVAVGGTGGSSLFGGGGGGNFNAAGSNAHTYGGGGGGGCTLGSTSAVNGGNGYLGIVIITEYI